MSEAGDAGDAIGAERPLASLAPPDASPVASAPLRDAPADGAARRAVLRDLAAMIGVEVFY